MTLFILKLLIQLAIWFAKRANKPLTAAALVQEIEIVQGKRIRKAADARDGVLSGRVQPDPDDPNRRD